MGQQAVSYIPAQPQAQTASYIPAAQPVTVTAQPYQQAVSYGAPTYISAQPQTASYIPAAAPVVETISAQPQVASYIPAAQPTIIESGIVQQSYTTGPATYAMPQVASYVPAAQTVVSSVQPAVTYAAPVAQPTSIVETISPGVTTIPQQLSYIPAAQPQVVEAYGAPAAEPAMASGQSVIVEQVGDWLVCEDAQGVFYHHTPTQQSFDNPPAEFLALFPQGYNPPALGAFAAGAVTAAPAPAVVQQAIPQVASYIPAQQPASYIPAQQPASYIPAQQPMTMAPQYATTVAYGGSPVVETMAPTQMFVQ